MLKHKLKHKDGRHDCYSNSARCSIQENVSIKARHQRPRIEDGIAHNYTQIQGQNSSRMSSSNLRAECFEVLKYKVK